jgi:PAS domain-containing protein
VSRARPQSAGFTHLLTTSVCNLANCRQRSEGIEPDGFYGGAAGTARPLAWPSMTCPPITDDGPVRPELPEHLLRLAFDRMPVGISFITPDRRVLLTNPALSRILGYPAEQLRGMSITEVTHPKTATPIVGSQRSWRKPTSPPAVLQIVIMMPDAFFSSSWRIQDRRLCTNLVANRQDADADDAVARVALARAVDSQ